MLPSKAMRSAKLAGEATRANMPVPRALPNSTNLTRTQQTGIPKELFFLSIKPAHARAPSQRYARAAAVSSAEAATAVVTTETGLMELNKDTFYDFLDKAGDTVVVVDFFTDWCGPCKLIYPELVKLSAELSPAAHIVKFNCNQANKELAKSLGIKVAPTFHLYKRGEKVADMTGAKVDKLRSLIEEQLNQN